MIGVLFTGGTISMKLDPESGAAVPALGAEEILEQVPGIRDIADLDVEDFSRLPGPHVTPDGMWRLARRAAAWLERPDIDGLVITHGTDTIEETAFLLDLVLLSEKPVVFVGAMRTVSDVGWDGAANLLAAVRVAASPDARGRGVVVVMDDRILPAREVRKVHTESSASFSAAEFGPLGQVDAGTVLFRRAGLPRPVWQSPIADPGLRVARVETRVDLLQVYTGMDGTLLSALAERGPKGLALVAFGRGNVPPSVLPELGWLIEHGTLVTVSSRSLAGRVTARYGYEGGGLTLQRIGAILAGDLSGAKARLLMMVALGHGETIAEARAIVEDVVNPPPPAHS